jgi:hypothetical protein
LLPQYSTILDIKHAFGVLVSFHGRFFEAMALGGRLVTSSGKMEMSPDDAQHLWAKELGLPGDQLGDWGLE